jgi:hypothetical protein
MNCNEFKIQIDRYLDRDLPANEAHEVQNHLTVCPACREEYGPLIELLTAPAEIIPSPALQSRILKTIGATPDRQRNLWRFRLATAAAIVLLVLGWLVRPVSSPPAPVNTPLASETSQTQPDPWLLAGLAQSFATTGTLNQTLPLVQARLMKEWFQDIYQYEPKFQPDRTQYTLHLPEPSVTQIDFPMLEFALFSSMQKL